MKALKRFLLGLGMAAASLGAVAEMIDMDPSEIVAKYGKPDRVQSSEKERPKPMFITRMMEYKKAGVRASLLANDKEPPYTHWKLMGFQDVKSNKVISLEEFESRIKTAKK